MSLEKKQVLQRYTRDTEQCFLNPVYGEMKGILGFVNRHEADDQRDDAGNKERVAIVNACQHKIEHQAQIEGQRGQKEHTLLREKPEQDKGGDSPAIVPNIRSTPFCRVWPMLGRLITNTVNPAQNGLSRFQ